MRYKNIDLNAKRVLLILSISLFFISLLSPVYCADDGCYYGFPILLLGWVLFVVTPTAVGWIANPLLFLAWISNKRFPVLSLIFSLIAFLIALVVPALPLINSYINEIYCYRIGYWLWMASCLLMSTGTAIGLILQHKKVKNDTQS